MMGARVLLMTTTNTKRNCPLCGKAVKILATGAYARHGHRHAAGSGGGGCNSWRHGPVGDKAIVEMEIAGWERTLATTDKATRCHTYRRIEEVIAKLRRTLAALSAA
jgi:hypothetical protein